MTKERTAATNVLPSPKDLNEKAIKAAKPGDTLWDANVKGLHLRAMATKKVFYLYYRTKAGIQRKPPLGAYGSITLTQAREMAKGMLAIVGTGGDPSKGFADARNEKTVADLWDEFYKRRGSKKKSHAEDERLWLKKCQCIAKKRLSELDYGSMADLHEAISEDAPISANRTIALLKTMFNFAIKPLEWTDSNPCVGVEMNRENKRKRYMTAAEAATIYSLLEKKGATDPAGAAFVWLLILTGARRGEIAKAKWNQVQGNAIVLSEHKTDGSGKDRVIQLTQAALDVLGRLPRTTGTITGILSPRTMWETIRTEADCPDLRLHDLRHSFASAGISAGLTLAQIGELLGQSNTETTKRYAHLMDEAAALAATSTTDIIMERMRPRTAALPPQTLTIQ